MHEERRLRCRHRIEDGARDVPRVLRREHPASRLRSELLAVHQFTVSRKTLSAFDSLPPSL
ncbi:MAG TPA: hypothetical protein VD972_18775 [Hyalangium sp.]|nr:hypothetical protein [Hyalangium sp.]